MKDLRYILCLLMVSALVPLWAAGGASAGDKLSGNLGLLSGDDEARVIVMLADQLDPESVTKGVKGRNKGLRTKLLVEALKDKKYRTQKNLLKLLGEWGGKGRAKNVREFWIFNGVAVTAPRDVLDDIASLPEVLEIYPDTAVYLEEPVLAAVSAEDNLTLVNAPAMWDMGYTGQGVVVANVDSGVDGEHPDLAPRYRGGTNSWYDPNGEHATPYDFDGHGTQTMGVMVGGDLGDTAVGVAPGAQWIAVKAFDDSGVAYTSALHAGYQWLLDPDGNTGTDDAPDVVNNSWGDVAAGFCDEEFAPDIAALRAAGILPVFSAGNDGPSGGTDISPANNDGALSVGATDNFDNPALFSSRGPSTCDGGLFPTLSAPGYGIRTTSLSYGGSLQYAYVSGTSFSAPHVSGVAALLLSASPSLTPDELEAAMTDGAADIFPAGPDYTTGYGRVDALASYYSIVPEVILAPVPLSPADGSDFWKKGEPEMFSWEANSAVYFELQVSKYADFYKMKVFPYTAAGPTVNFLPDYKTWKKILKHAKIKKGVQLPAYWRVKGIDVYGNELFSETRTFTIYKELPLP